MDLSHVAPSPVLPNNYPSALPTPTTHTLTFCKSGFGILCSDLPDKRRLCGALRQGNHCKVSKLLCGQPTLALQGGGGGGAAALQPPSFLYCDWKPELGLPLPSARSISFKDKAGVCTRSLRLSKVGGHLLAAMVFSKLYGWPSLKHLFRKPASLAFCTVSILC